MIINQFRKFTATNILYLIVLGLLLCASMLFRKSEDPTILVAGESLFMAFGKIPVITLAPAPNVLITLSLTIIQALYLNKVMNKYYFTVRPGFLIALMYVTLASLVTPFLILTPHLICNFMVIWMLDKLIGIHYRERAVASLFDLGMIVALGSLIYVPFIANLLVVWVALFLFRPFHWREWVASLIGALVVYFLLWLVYFWHDQPVHFKILREYFTNWSFSPLSSDYRDYLVGIPVLLILLLFLDSLRRYLFKRIVLIRKIIQLLAFMLFMTLISMLLNPERQTGDLLLLAPTLSVYSAFYFYHSTTKWLYESVYILLIFTILLFQFI